MKQVLTFDQSEFVSTKHLGASLSGSPEEGFRGSFCLWAPGADEVRLIFAEAAKVARSYNSPEDVYPAGRLVPDPADGSWSITADIPGSPESLGYRYIIVRGGKEYPFCDPYARALLPFPGVRAEKEEGELHGWAVLTPPEGPMAHRLLDPPGGWENHRRVNLEQDEGAESKASGDSSGNIVIYEAMVRDFTIHPDSGVPPEIRGTYLGMARKLDYIASLGVTHIQLLPVMKAYSADERKREHDGNGDTTGGNYNWGYDPLSYFVPEGWFSADPEDPYARIRELKTLIKEAHRRGLGIILDVVYNHMARTHSLEASCPGYWFRRNHEGNFTSNSGCGNDFASERPMARRLVHDSLRYFLEEFCVDGFRFDLMGLIDDRTVLEVDAMLREINPDIVMLGEGWRMYNGAEGTSGMDQDRASDNIPVAMFSDEIRDLLKGGGLNEASPGFVSGLEVDKHHLLHNLLGNPQHNFRTFSPRQVVNYLVCHDGLTLRDSLAYNGGLDPENPADRRELIQRIKAANLMLATSQGVVFLHAGQERGRTKPNLSNSARETIGPYVHNSYNSGDSINAFPWQDDDMSREILEHVKLLLAFRKRENLLHLGDHGEIHNRKRIIDTEGPWTLAYALDDGHRGLLIMVNLEHSALRTSLSSVQNCDCPLRWIIGSGQLDGCEIVIPPMESAVIEFSCGTGD